MHIVEILLPLCDNEGHRFGHAPYEQVREELVARFGGLTAFTRSPAEGLWEDEGERSRDQIVIFEVMSDGIDRNWWEKYRAELEILFRQERIIVRAHEVEII
ncbi:hypothetical protein E2493_04660 [Sphingomonas parva]|uniref:DUF1330 domain-containing protein n=1 Tax=Sphingomonas parva TaxID=2555898 RepID=A0A4Y8ZY60_9SPHN|nr:hypothetical protein [Sphingomonas parva]TFI59486.1 hypothetical protein E2493_04660 [Sphingomonas parva]